MSLKKPSQPSYYQIVKYNMKTRKDLKVLPGRVQGLSEVNRRIHTLNTRLRASKVEQDQDSIFYRRKVKS